MGLRILQLCKKYPFPLRDGESIAINYLSNALTEIGCEVSLLAMNTTKHFVDKEEIQNACPQYKEIHTILVDNKVKALDAFINLFSADSYHISRFISSEFKRKLTEILSNNEYDIIQLETLYLTPYIPIIKKHTGAKICMRAHNIEYEIWERITANTTNIFKRWYLSYLTKKLKEYEIQHLNDYDFLVSVSNRDLKRLKKLGYKNGAASSPIGLNLLKYGSPIKVKSKQAICFIGALDWVPNLEGLKWFINNVWPTLYERNPQIELHIAGRNISTEISNLKLPNIIIHGEVENAIDFINAYDIMIVPLLSGSGTRVKILEGMMLGKTIITTTLGKEGIEVSHDEHLLIADEPTQFIDAIETSVVDIDIKRRLGTNAKKYVKKHYNHLENAKDLVEEYNLIISNNY